MVCQNFKENQILIPQPKYGDNKIKSITNFVFYTKKNIDNNTFIPVPGDY